MIETNSRKKVTLALNVLYIKKEKIYPPYVSKYNSNREKTTYSFNDFKRRKTIALSCSKKTISIIKRNNV